MFYAELFTLAKTHREKLVLRGTAHPDVELCQLKTGILSFQFK